MDDALLKEKEEIQEYLKNLGIEYRYSCYKEKKPEACHLLSEYLTQITKEYSKSNEIFQMNCDENNYGRSCSSYAIHLLNGNGCVKNVKESLKYFSKACDLNDAIGCDFSGKILAGFESNLQKLVELNPPKGLEYLEKGCNLNNPSTMFESAESCYAAAFLCVGGKYGVKKDIPKAIQFASTGCHLGQINGCRLAHMLYKEEGNSEMAQKFKILFERLRKQIDSNVQLDMQRT